MQGGEAKLLDRCAEGMLFGALPPCPSCDEGQLVCVRGVEYKCTGYASGTLPLAVQPESFMLALLTSAIVVGRR